MTDKIKPFYKDIVRVLQNMGGKAKAAEVVERVMQDRNITEADYKSFETKTMSGLGAVKNPIRWARQHLVYTGYLRQDSDYGYWELSDKGQTAKPADLNGIGRVINKIIAERKQKRDKSGQGALSGAQSPDLPERADPQLEEDDAESRSFSSDEDRLQEDILAELRELSPYQFERVCKLLLTEMGLEDVNVTPQSRDGGFDGEGYLATSPLVKTKIVFECKRYQKGNPVTVQAVRNVQAAISYKKKGEKGVVITTSDFTPDAKKEANEGNSRIELIDGEALVGLFVRYKLGVKEKTVMEVDDDFFARFKDKR